MKYHVEKLYKDASGKNYSRTQYEAIVATGRKLTVIERVGWGIVDEDGNIKNNHLGYPEMYDTKKIAQNAVDWYNKKEEYMEADKKKIHNDFVLYSISSLEHDPGEMNQDDINQMYHSYIQNNAEQYAYDFDLDVGTVLGFDYPTLQWVIAVNYQITH